MKQGAEVIIVPTYWLATDITERGLKYDPECVAALPGTKRLESLLQWLGRSFFPGFDGHNKSLRERMRRCLC
jgi:hypothetical protein